MSARLAPDVPVAVVRPASRREVRSRVPKAYTPGRELRKERKVLDAGARSEALVDALLARKASGVLAWRLPGIRHRRLSGVAYVPDMGASLEELDGLVEPQLPQVAGRPAYNAVIEVKAQHTPGSAEKKISTAITDLSYLSDEIGVPSALVLDTPILTDQQVLTFKAEGEEQAVVVLTMGEVKAGELIPALVAVAKRRKKLANRLGPRGGYRPTKRPDAVERSFALRLTRRRALLGQLRQQQTSPLVR